MALAQDTLKVGSLTVPIVSKGMGTQEVLGSAASKAYSVGNYFVGNDGYYYLVSQNIASGGTITVGTNCTKTDLAAVVEGKAPNNHASAQTTYGLGDANNYGHVKVDTALSADSTNPVQNKVVNTALGTKAPTNHASTQTTYGVGSTTNYGHVKVDDALSDSSTNPVQNKKVKAAVDEVKQALSDLGLTVVNGKLCAVYNT